MQIKVIKMKKEILSSVNILKLHFKTTEISWGKGRMKRERLTNPTEATRWGVGGSSEMGCIVWVYECRDWPWEDRDVTISEREEENQCSSVLFGLEVKWTENEYIFLQQHRFPWTWGFSEPILNKSTDDTYVFLSCFEVVATISKIEETVSPVYGGSSTGLCIHR